MLDKRKFYKIDGGDFGQKTETVDKIRRCSVCGYVLSKYNIDKAVIVGKTKKYFCFSHKEIRAKLISDEYLRKVNLNEKKSREKNKQNKQNKQKGIKTHRREIPKKSR